MKLTNKIAIALLALGSSGLFAMAQDNNQNDGPPPGAPAQRGPGAAGGAQRGQPGFHLLPPIAMQQLDLSDDQKKQLAALETETKGKLEKILTPDQMTQLKNLRPPMQMRQGGPGNMQGGQRGPGGRGFGGPGPGPNGGNNFPPGPPPGNGDGNFPPPGPPPGDN
jgi:hypothetical protein